MESNGSLGVSESAILSLSWEDCAMRISQVKKKDTKRLVRKLEDVILEHRIYFASWRSNRWSEFDKATNDREKERATRRKQ